MTGATERRRPSVNQRLAVLVVALSLFGASWNVVDGLDRPPGLAGVMPAADVSLEAAFDIAPTTTRNRYHFYTALREVAADGVILVAAPEPLFETDEFRWLARMSTLERPDLPTDPAGADEPARVIEGSVQTRPMQLAEEAPRTFRILVADGSADTLVLLPGGDLVLIDARLLPKSP